MERYLIKVDGIQNVYGVQLERNSEVDKKKIKDIQGMIKNRFKCNSVKIRNIKLINCTNIKYGIKDDINEIYKRLN